MPDFGFVGASYVAPSIYQDDQECINYYPEVDPTKGQASATSPAERGIVALYPTPGLLLTLQLMNVAQVRCLWVLPGGSTMLAVSGNKLYSVTSQFVATEVGTLLTQTGQVSISDNGTAAYIGDGNNRYSYVWSTNTFAVISDGAFNGADRIDEVDGFFIYNKPSSNQWGSSNVNSTVSNALNFSSKDGSSDNIVTLIADHREVFLIGERTTEVWVDVGAFPFPFQRIPGTTIQHGCVAKASVTRFGETIAWLSADARGQGVVVQTAGYSLKRISTHAVETAIRSYSTISDAVAYAYQAGGHEFYVLTFPSADVTWVYDAATELWHKRAWRDAQNIYHRHRGNCYAFFQGKNLVGDYQNGQILELNYKVFTENGAPLPRVRRAPHLTQGLKRQFFNSLQIQFQPGVGLVTGQGQNPQAMLRWSDDGGSTWSNEHWVSIGLLGKYKNRAIWRRLGYARDRIFEVVVTDPIFAPIISAELDVEGADS